MPILDPIIQCSLLEKIGKTENSMKSAARFYLKYLKIASKYINQNYSTIDTSILIKKHIKEMIDLFNAKFNCQITNEFDIDNEEIDNIYNHLYQCIIKSNYRSHRHIKNTKGSYYTFNDKFGQKFFHPNIFYNSMHSWFFSDTPIAVLCINSAICEDKSEFSDFCKFVNFEIDLMKASGFTLVLCIKDSLNQNDFLFNFIDCDRFSEIHYNITNITQKSKFAKLKKGAPFNYLPNFRGYFYFYSPFIDPKFSVLNEIIEEFRKKPTFFVLNFAQEPSKCLKILDPDENLQPFAYCQNGFDFPNLRVNLSNVALYDNKSKSKSLVATRVSGCCFCYTNSSHFLNWQKSRVEVLVVDENKHNRLERMFIEFKDLHVINPELYVKETLLLAEVNLETYKTTDEIMNKIRVNKIVVEINEIISRYTKCIRTVIPDFQIRKSQIYTIVEAADNILNGEINKCQREKKKEKDKNDNKYKGIIFQVDTGEGKTCIINILAALLARYGKTVHIASSNIKLSNRDYYESYDFFTEMNLKSSVLLHENELPFDLEDEKSLKDNPKKKKYPDDFFKKDVFYNSSKMNFSVCGLSNINVINTKKKANVVFSTFFNFECFYLRMLEMCPSFNENYYNNCVLIIDEADSILIDEITNGTIISHEMNSNAKQVLNYVYDQYEKGFSYKGLYNKVTKNFPQCKDITEIDIKQMYDEIKLVKDESFSKKYYIEKFEVKNINKVIKNLTKTINTVCKVCNNAVEKLLYIDQTNDEKEEKEEDYEFNPLNDITKKYCDKIITFHHVVPFDYENKGILEPNKMFSGFISQFIAIKEAKTNNYENMIVNDLSMDYLYISHPIFTKLYGKICGFTGTLGDKNDKDLYLNEYNLVTKIIPRNKSNLRIEFPMIICKDIQERNEIIVDEIIGFNKKEFPVLVIFQDLREIEDVAYLLGVKGINLINIYDGKDPSITPGQKSGKKCAVTLGTNICGRGIDIKVTSNQLHVIITYYTSNARVMAQAYGRTARKGQKGTYRVICLESQYFSTNEKFDKAEVTNAINDFSIKNTLQKEFIDHFQKEQPWIFSSNIEKPILTKEDINILRKVQLNINRIVAYKFKYPICMTVDTFLKIQEQKIFSLFNCPNSKYTWKLFQRYIREMIFECWSITINKFDLYHNSEKRTKEYKDKFEEEKENLIKKLDTYFEGTLKSKCKYVTVFLNIYNKVAKAYQEKALLNFPSLLSKPIFDVEPISLCSFFFGVKPYSLLNYSGARIEGGNDINYIIKDPEIAYIQRDGSGIFSLLSITKAIDFLFNKLFQIISGFLQEKIFLKFFMRRTLGGLEFGICFEAHSNIDCSDLKNDNLFFDTDPLLCFTIFVKTNNRKPIIAFFIVIIIIFVGVLLSQMNKIIDKLKCITPQGVIVDVAEIAVSSLTNMMTEQIIKYLKTILDKQIQALIKYDQNIGNSIKALYELISTTEDKSAQFASDKFGEFIKIKTNLGNFISKFIKGKDIAKIGLLILLNISVFVFNFRNNKQLKLDKEKLNGKISQAEKISTAYNYSNDDSKMNKLIEDNVNIIDAPKIDDNS